MVDKELILSMINEFLPKTKIYAFGSRVNNTAQKYSDLDLALDMGEPIGLLILSNLEESFSESDIPYKVDLVDFQRVTEEFQNIILTTGEQWQ